MAYDESTTPWRKPSIQHHSPDPFGFHISTGQQESKSLTKRQQQGHHLPALQNQRALLVRVRRRSLPLGPKLLGSRLAGDPRRPHGGTNLGRWRRGRPSRKRGLVQRSTGWHRPSLDTGPLLLLGRLASSLRRLLLLGPSHTACLLGEPTGCLTRPSQLLGCWGAIPLAHGLAGRPCFACPTANNFFGCCPRIWRREDKSTVLTLAQNC